VKSAGSRVERGRFGIFVPREGLEVTLRRVEVLVNRSMTRSASRARAASRITLFSSSTWALVG
jgi:hypothetical protein